MPPSACSADRQPTFASPHAEPMLGPIGPGRGVGGRLPDGRGRQRDGRVGHPRFQKSRLGFASLLGGCLSLVLVFTREGWGMGVSSFSGRGLGDEDANDCLEVRSDTKRTFYLSKIFFNL